MSEWRLIPEIIARSVAKEWSEAKREWMLVTIWKAQLPTTCLCSHYPIRQVCSLRNTINGNCAEVGNCCVTRLLPGTSAERILQSFKRVCADKHASLNIEAISYAFGKKWITEWERNFYLDIRRRRNLTPKQSRKKVQINEKVMQKYATAKSGC